MKTFDIHILRIIYITPGYICNRNNGNVNNIFGQLNSQETCLHDKITIMIKFFHGSTYFSFSFSK